jgi:hypothetical protein
MDQEEIDERFGFGFGDQDLDQEHNSDLMFEHDFSLPGELRRDESNFEF